MADGGLEAGEQIQISDRLDRRYSAKFFIRNFFFSALPIVLVTMILGYMTFWLTFRNAEKILQTNQEQTVARICDGMEVFFSEADAQSLNYSISPYAMVRLRALLEHEYAEKEYMDIAYMIKPFIDSNVNGKEFLQSEYVYLENENHNFFASGIGLANQLNHDDTEWIEKALQQEASVTQWLELRTISAYRKSSYLVDVITLYKRFYGSGYSGPIGVLVLNMSKNYIEQFMAGYLSFENQSILMVDKNGVVLCRAGEVLPDEIWTDDVLWQELKNTYFIDRQENLEYEVTYLSLVPKSNAKRMVSDLVRIVWIFIFAALFLGMTMAFWLTRRNARSIESVMKLLRLAEQGETLPKMSRKKDDEYSYIMQSVIKNYLEKSTLQMQLTERKHKLDSMYYLFLQSQLSPHFLFNTLENIFWKTMKLTGGPNETSKMMDLLTNLLYYALVRPDKFVNLSEEVKMTMSYLEIQKMRFEDRFVVVWDWKQELEEYQTIKFVLQPLLENSITHGIGQQEKTGNIEIHIREEDGWLKICVKDDGVGMTKEKLAKIEENLMQEEAPVGGIGLYNLNKRLILTYGEKSALAIESRAGEGTRVSFQIPAQKHI